MPTFPIELGLGAFSGADHSTFWKLFRRLQGEGGYSDQEESYRVRELLVWGYGAAIGASAVERAAAQTFIELATELLDQIEQAMELPNTAARNDTLRKIRMEAVMRGGPRRPQIEAALTHLGVTATYLTNLREYVDTIIMARNNYSEESIHQVAVILPDAEYDDHQLRTAVVDVLEKSLPMRSMHHMHDKARDAVVAARHGCRWDTDPLDRCVLAQKTVPDSYDHVNHPSRLLDFGPLSKLRAEHLNALQDNLLFGPASNTDTMTTALAGGERIAVAMQTASGERDVDSSVDWRDRLVFFIGRISGNDIRPGETDDDETNHTATLAVSLGFTGPGSTSSTTGYRVAIDANAWLWVDTTAGSPTNVLRVHDASGPRYLVGYLIASPPVDERVSVSGETGLPRITSFSPEDTAPDTAWFDAVFASANVRAASNSDLPNIAGAGGVCRVGAAVNISQPVGTASYILDTTVDWRDRYLIVNAWGRESPSNISPTFPGILVGDSGGGETDRMHTAFGYTGLGTIESASPPHAWQIPLNGINTSFILYADSNDGHLKLRVDNVASYDRYTAYFDIWATAQLGEHSSPTALPSVPVGTDGQDIEPIDLNVLQDGAMLTQMRQERPDKRAHIGNQDGTSIADDSISWPMGPVAPSPSRARQPSTSQMIPRGMVDYAAGSLSPLTYTLRQSPAGGLFRFFSQDCTASTTVIDDGDWRDRLVTIYFVRATGNDIRPGETDDALLDDGSIFRYTRYMGAGEDPDLGDQIIKIEIITDLYFHVLASDGKLVVTREGAVSAPQYMVGFAFGSFKLGAVA